MPGVGAYSGDEPFRSQRFEAPTLLQLCREDRAMKLPVLCRSPLVSKVVAP